MRERIEGLLALSLGAALAALLVGSVRAQEPPQLTRIQYVVSAAGPSDTRVHRRHAERRRVAPQRQIACTVLGCNPVPPGCHPEPQRYFSGMTTGFDAVVCP
jgi:hypothetical protein